ncbi:hypothetical protein SEUCBS139899_000694 [Sporothrix eucalyptigena]
MVSSAPQTARGKPTQSSSTSSRPASAKYLKRVRMHQGPTGSLMKRCALWSCSATASMAKLMKCTGCRAVLYCSRAHQAAHRAEHKDICWIVAESREAIVVAEEELHNNILVRDQRSYDQCLMKRLLLVYQLQLIGTLDCVTDAYEHEQALVNFDRADPGRAQDVLGITLPRLDRDQEAFDTLCWWASFAARPRGTGHHAGRYGGQLRKADVLSDDPVHLFMNKGMQEGIALLSHRVAVLLLKLKLLLDLRAVRHLRTITAKYGLPEQLRLMIEPDVVLSSLSRDLFLGLSNSEAGALDTKLTRHCLGLLASINKDDNFYLLALLEAHSNGVLMRGAEMAIINGPQDEAAMLTSFSPPLFPPLFNNQVAMGGFIRLRLRTL